MAYPYAYCATPDGRILFLTGYSPIFQLREFRADGTCDVIGEAYTTAQRATAHPEYGFALLTTDGQGIKLAQIDLDGQLLRSSTTVYESESYPSLLDYTIADNGDIYVLWRDDYSQLKLLIIPWDAVLSAPRDAITPLPTDLSLAAYPNPFNSSVTLRYDVPRAGNVDLAVYDLQGRLVETLRDESAQAGSHELRWSPQDAASGVYVVHFTTSAGRATQKLLYLK
ncbi:MAG: T9SS type A sorting domain-containing protein [bacterium]|nr:T9SS type A sorting domain-containing protein [bacterium]